jgi:hypothetical protein
LTNYLFQARVPNNNNSPSYGIVTTLRRIESLLLSTAEDVSNINDTLNCHIDSTNKQFQDIQDKFTSFSNTVKVQTNSALAAVEEVFTQTQLIKSEIDLNNQTFANKSKSLWDKVNGVLEEVKAVKTSVV